jgi:hypothetical protein
VKLLTESCVANDPRSCEYLAAAVEELLAPPYDPREAYDRARALHEKAKTLRAKARASENEAVCEGVEPDRAQ